MRDPSHPNLFLMSLYKGNSVLNTMSAEKGMERCSSLSALSDHVERDEDQKLIIMRIVFLFDFYCLRWTGGKAEQ